MNILLQRTNEAKKTVELRHLPIPREKIIQITEAISTVPTVLILFTVIIHI